MEFDLDSFVTLDGLTEFNSCVVPVLVDDGGEKIRVAGSAFNIHPHGLWVTARHVIEDAIKNHRDAHIYLLWTDPEVSTEAAPSWLDSEDVPDSPLRLGALVPVTRFTKDDSGGSDLALLRAGMLRDGEPHMFPVCRLSARVPRTGTRVLAMGYARSNVAADTETTRVRRIAFARSLSVSTGEVLQVYREGRDTFRDLDGRPRGTMPTVCFQTSARFDGGMSGGPVMDENGAICGIVSTGGAFDDCSFASATPLLFTLGVPHDDEDDVLTVYQLAQAGVVAVDGYFERLIVTYDENGQGTIAYLCEDDDAAE